jgi:polysaccharide export outer membrane protein
MMKVNLFPVLLIVSLFASPVSSSERYFLNAGDQLNISVWNEDALQKDVIVLPDGMISFPLAGELLAKGKTVTELQKALTEKLTDYLSNPVVTVSVTSVLGNTIHIMGKVLSPGPRVMNQNLDVMQALSLAGGLSPFAQEDDIIVLRRIQGKQTVIPVDYTELKQGKGLEDNVLLKSGDLIIIP